MPASFTLATEAILAAESFGSEFHQKMDKKRYLAYALVAAILAALIYMQFRTWKGFDWATFWDQSRQVSSLHILNSILLIYFSYFLRALRWKIFLRRVRREISAVALIRPTLIGFTGLALLGPSGRIDSSLPHRSSNQSYFFLAVSSLGHRAHI